VTSLLPPPEPDESRAAAGEPGGRQANASIDTYTAPYSTADATAELVADAPSTAPAKKPAKAPVEAPAEASPNADDGTPAVKTDGAPAAKAAPKPRAKSAAAKPGTAKSATAKTATSKTATAKTATAKSATGTGRKTATAAASPAQQEAKTVAKAKTPAKKRAPRAKAKPAEKPSASVPQAALAPVVLTASGLVKKFGQNVAVSGIDLEVRAGSFYGIVGPNGAGKTTTLSMITGLLRPDAGFITVHGIDVWAKPLEAKRIIGVLPDRLRLFDRLTGAQLLHYSGILRGLDSETVATRSADLAAAFGLEDALGRLVADYSAGMTKKIALACAMIHSPRILVLDEPFESVDPVSAVNVTEILQKYVASGGTVVLSSHGMDLIQRVCDHVAIIVRGAVLASGTVDEVRGAKSLEERFVELAGGRKVTEGMEWLHSFSD
jgi:ABC-2 type transport system ATP-binding protein